MTILSLIRVFKMAYQLFLYAFYLISLFLNVFFVCCNVLLPWSLIFLALALIASKFVRLKEPDEQLVHALLSPASKEDEVLSFPIANRGGYFDAPENSRACLERCAARKCRNILLDLDVTKCNELVLLAKTTVEKAGRTEPIHQLTLKDLEAININENHPLGSQFPAERVLTLGELINQHLDTRPDRRFFLLVANPSPKLIECLKERIATTPTFAERFVLVTTSPLAVYQVRKQFPALVCGLWIDRTIVSKKSYFFKTSAILRAMFMAIFRNIVAPVVGVKAVFLHKDEFNAHVAHLWHNVGVRPIVYTVNSPNEKRYFQQVIKTQYLTDSLRSEPQVIFSKSNGA